MQQIQIINEEICTYCDHRHDDHTCIDCENSISERTCAEFEGLCEQCMWLLSK